MKCTKCNNKVQPDWEICPLCEEELHNKCKQCNAILQTGWIMCPYCREAITEIETPEQQIETPDDKQVQQEDIQYIRLEIEQEYEARLEKELNESQEQYNKEIKRIHQEIEQEYEDKIEDERLVRQKQQVKEVGQIHKELQQEFKARSENEQEQNKKQQYIEVGHIRRELKEEFDKRLKDELNKSEEAKQEQKQTSPPTNQQLPIYDSAFVTISPGSFIMGSPEEEYGRKKSEKQHQVDISGFEMMNTPVTFEQYEKYCSKTGKEIPDDEGWGREDRPVINVSYWDAVDFCNWLTKQSERSYRLPTEAEWEYACKNGDETAFSYGNLADRSKMHCLSEDGTSRVAKLPANSNGLHDMHGNVWEWCASVWYKDYEGQEKQDASSKTDDIKQRILRGGSWFNSSEFCRSSSRYHDDPANRSNINGFRIVRELSL